MLVMVGEPCEDHRSTEESIFHQRPDLSSKLDRFGDLEGHFGWAENGVKTKKLPPDFFYVKDTS